MNGVYRKSIRLSCDLQPALRNGLVGGVNSSETPSPSLGSVCMQCAIRSNEYFRCRSAPARKCDARNDYILILGHLHFKAKLFALRFCLL